MFGLMRFLESSDSKALRERREEEYRERRMKLAVTWDPAMPYSDRLNIKADTYSPLNIFPEVKPSGHRHDKAGAEQRAVSPSSNWLYVNKQLDRGTELDTIYSGKVGDVLFDDPIIVPCLFQKASHRHDDCGGWRVNPFMSMTPMEYFSLRPGTRLAKGHTVIAGMGLGHQLIEVAKRKKVKEITLVEKSQELVDWLLPRIMEHVSGRPALNVIVGDANDVLPTLEADVALIDIWDSYGGNEFRHKTPGIGKVWCWGAPSVPDSGRGYYW